MTTNDIKTIDFPASSQVNKGPEQQAAEWAAYMHAEDVTAEGRERFSKWYAVSEENRMAYKYIEQSWDIADFAIVSDADLDAELAGFARKKRFSMIKSLPNWGVAALAASIMITIGLGITIVQNMTQPQDQRYATLTGEIKTITLVDGSKITLAGATTLMAHFSKARREAELVNGQAYFDVIHDPSRPFLIHTGAAEVRVLGTEFDIQKTSSDVRISVTEGVVEVAEAPNVDDRGDIVTDKLQLSTTDAPVKLQVGEQIHVTTSGARSAITPFKQDSLLAWREGRFEYNKTPLSRVIDEVNRYRSIKVTLADENLADMPVTIAFSVHQTEDLFEGLNLTGLVDVVRTPEGVTIHSK